MAAIPVATTLLMNAGAPAFLVNAASFLPSLTTIGAGLGLAGTLYSNKAESGADIAAAEANARIARENANIAYSQTQADIEKQHRAALLRKGSNTAAAGASGLGIGSKFDILSDNAAQEELDILTLKHAGQLKQNAYLQEAGLDTASTKAKKRAFLPGQAATALTGAAKTFGLGQVV